MPGLLSQIQLGSKALTAQSKAIEIAGKNLANVSNPAYARQRVTFSARGTIETAQGSESMGLEATGLRQYRDQFLDKQVIRETSVRGTLVAKQSVLDRMQTALGQRLDRADDSASIGNDTGAAGAGISESLSDFFNAFERLSAKPTDVGERQLLMQKANILANKINTSDSRLAQLQEDITGQIDTDVVTVNGILDSIADLNGQINRSENGKPGSALDLRDQRQAKLEELAQYMNFETRPSSGGNGQVDIIAKDGTNTDVVLLERNIVRGPIAFDGTNFTGGSPATQLAFVSGGLKGQVDVRDGELQVLRDDIAAMASQMTTAVNGAYNPTNATGNFFATAPAAGLLIQVDPAVTATNLKTTDSVFAGNNELAVAVAAIADKKFSTTGGDAIDGTPTGFFSAVVGRVGEELNSTNERLDTQILMEQFVVEQRDNVSGVSLDEETTDLMRFQRAFEASARYVNVIDGLLDLVVNGLGSR